MRAFIKRRSDSYDERFKNFTGSKERFLELELEAIEREADRMKNDFESMVIDTLNNYVVDGVSGDHEVIQVNSNIQQFNNIL
jgi:hypothetical protein